MHLKGLVGLAAGLPAFQDVARALAAGRSESIAALPDAVKPLVLAALWRSSGRPLMVVTPRPEAARRLHEQIVAYAGEDPAILLFPEPDSLPYERLASDPSTVHQRLAALAALVGLGQHGGGEGIQRVERGRRDVERERHPVPLDGHDLVDHQTHARSTRCPGRLAPGDEET